MRLWHKDLIPYLPDLQLKSQWRECLLIADTLAKNGTPDHLLVKWVTEYPLDHFFTYCKVVELEMFNRGFEVKNNSRARVFYRPWRYFFGELFDGWHNKEYLRICMSNLAEKHFYGIGKSRITDEEWQRLCVGYKAITGEEYKI